MASNLDQNIINWLVEHGVQEMEDFPVISPDFNAIEYVWSWLKHVVSAAQPHDYQTLKAAIRSASMG